MILDEKIRQRLGHALESLENGTNRIRRPAKLLAAVAAVSKKWGKGAVGTPEADVVERIVQRISRPGYVPTRRDLFYLSFSLSGPLDALAGRCILESKDLFSQLIGTWGSLASRGRLSRLMWRGLYSSYFLAENRAVAEELRLFLNRTKTSVFSVRSDRLHPWMEQVNRHAEVLGTSPCLVYANGLLADDRAHLDDLLSANKIPPISWFWTELTEALCQILKGLSEARFRDMIPTFLELAEAIEKAKTPVFAALINRFPALRDQSKHDLLLAVLVCNWGSPQLDLSTKWVHATPAAKAIACGWLAQEDLEDFYRVCQQNGEVDDRRLKYWLRFKRQMRFTKIALGAYVATSNHPDYAAFRERKKGRLARLTDQEDNNAIIIQIGGWVFAEFSQVNHACYPYRLDLCPFNKDRAWFSVGDDLKSQSAVRASSAKRLRHVHWWEDSFDNFLQSKGIFPDR